MSLNLNDLAKTSYQIAKEKGWWDSPRPDSTLILLMLSELSEALEDYRVHKGLSETYYETKTVFEANSGCPQLFHLETDPNCTCYRQDKKPCGIPVELADYVIRVCDFLGHKGADVGALYEITAEFTPENKYDPSDFENGLAFVSARTAKAIVSWSDENDFAMHRSLAWALRGLFETCAFHGIDLEKAIVEKEAYNRTRSIRHGGKRI